MKKYIILSISLILCLVGSAFGATLTVVTPSDALEMDAKGTVEIHLDGLTDTEKAYMESSGAAFTIEYDDNLMLAPGTLNSTFFDTFQAQFDAAGTDPNPYTGPVDGYDRPVVINDDDTAGRTRVAAARCAKTSEGYVLFTLDVQLKDTSDSKAGVYKITVKPTVLNNVDAGYSADGEAIDLVVGSDSDKEPTDENAYPVIIAKDFAEVSGSVTFKASNGEDDDDNDGLTNAKEAEIGTNPNKADTDGDKFNDGVEVDAGTDPLDPNDYPRFNFDIDGDGDVDALSDGTLIMRYLFGGSGNALIESLDVTGGSRNNADSIAAFIELGMSGDNPALDIDADGDVDALSDGTMIMRFMFGGSGNALIDGLNISEGVNNSSSLIETHLNKYTLDR
jgi:hypothetical protein